LLFVQRLRALQLNELDEMLLILFCNLFVNDGEEYFYFQDIDFLHDRKGRLRHTMFCMGEGTNELVKLKLVESKLDDGFANRYSLHLTTDAKQSLFEELDIVIEQPKVRRDMILAKDIVHKNLYYGDTVTKKISELGGLLEDSQYRNIIQRLKDKGFRSGFACLLYGDPGTGKTETVLQLAKQTGRDIMQVNLSQIKSKWVGDSEKNIKAVFDCYRRRAKECEKTPILLFNEADGVISRRKENAENSVDKMENTMQNIILQEMETFEGIMIATTNLAQNMDKAFERRFLYKIKFEKPTMEARLNMWHDMIPELDENDTQIIAEMFNFSGGQIENIARRYTIDSILNESSANRLESLISFCEDEVVDYKPKRKIGY
jgi:SpoVK/Ycf46/Vps4 family AAA+-type ATPase